MSVTYPHVGEAKPVPCGLCQTTPLSAALLVKSRLRWLPSSIKDGPAGARDDIHAQETPPPFCLRADDRLV